jgi:hypothetical protein
VNSNGCFCEFSYQVVQFEGMSHNPVFTYQVTIGDMSTTGSGNSKNQAKHAAARKSISMTQLLTHTVAHSTRPSFRHKTNNQPTKKILSFGVT